MVDFGRWFRFFERRDRRRAYVTSVPRGPTSSAGLPRVKSPDASRNGLTRGRSCGSKQCRVPSRTSGRTAYRGRERGRCTGFIALLYLGAFRSEHAQVTIQMVPSTSTMFIATLYGLERAAKYWGTKFSRRGGSEPELSQVIEIIAETDGPEPNNARNLPCHGGRFLCFLAVGSKR